MASGSTEERSEQEQAVLPKHRERVKMEIEDEHDNATGWGTGLAKG
jgi:hypothetical protein